MAANPNPLPDPNEELVRVFDAEQESEAMVVSGLLESQGIDWVDGRSAVGGDERSAERRRSQEQRCGGNCKRIRRFDTEELALHEPPQRPDAWQRDGRARGDHHEGVPEYKPDRRALRCS